jgi:effector-binding domain-containing protein
MEVEVRIAHVKAQPLAVVRRQASTRELATVVPAACGVVWDVLRELQVPGAGRNVAVYLDDAIHLEVGVEVDAPFTGYGEVIGTSTPGGRVATATHVGPYDRLSGAHAAVVAWCAGRGEVLAGPSWEVYGHWIDDPARLRTDVFYLLRG